MRIISTSNNYNITSLQKTGSMGNYCLNWDSTGLEAFIVIVGEDIQDVKIDVNNEVSRDLKDILKQMETDIKSSENVFLNNGSISAYFVTFSQLKQKGGFSAGGRPGTYAVYGCQIKDEEMTVYVPEDNTLRISVDINIDDKPVIIQKKSLFKKTDVYSGYHKITIQKGISGLKGNVLFYTVSSMPHRFPFPNEILNKGGSFYVKCPEDGRIEFDTKNREGIRIRK